MHRASKQIPNQAAGVRAAVVLISGLSLLSEMPYHVEFKINFPSGFPKTKKGCIYIFFKGWVRAHFLGCKMEAPGAREPNPNKFRGWALNEIEVDYPICH